MGFLDKVFGTYSEREIKKLMPVVAKIEEFEATISQLTDDELKAKTEEFKKRYADGEDLDSMLEEAFAVVREASKRVLGMRQYPVQLLGGIILHQGRISEMRTGEGKTLVSVAPAYLNAIAGEGVHIVTVNEYLASRDAAEMGQIHNFLGLTVGVILSNMQSFEKQEAYACDITYATNNELGFDYLRDNMVTNKANQVLRGLNYSIIDEVDSVLIDEARTPLIISGQGKESTSLYQVSDFFVKTLTKGRIVNEKEALNPLYQEELIEEGDYIVDEKGKSASLTQEGISKAEKYFKITNLSDMDNLDIQHYISNALKANYIMHLDKDYVVQDGEKGPEIVIVDTFTGRLMPGRRYSDGLHQAIEAKEKLEVRNESKTLATITFQNFFNKYGKKSGMTGTALTEEGEFREIYSLDVVEIPTNKPVIRIDNSDLVYKTEKGKFTAIVREVVETAKTGQPMLIGTTTIDKSEQLSALLKREGIKHSVLNAKQHEREAEIVAQAGQLGSITIATNMAGRGTDIKLGEGVVELGGLKIIGTARHESRRIDNQLRGRAGRQGDPGESTFYLSLEDDLMVMFGSDKVKGLIEAMGLPEDEAIEAKILTKTIENAQKKVEAANFSTRKHLLDYDRVNNEQREVIYAERERVLAGEDIKDQILNMFKSLIEMDLEKYSNDSKYLEEWDLLGINEHFISMFGNFALELTDADMEKMEKEDVVNMLYDKAVIEYAKREGQFEEANMREIERVILLRTIDKKWMDHIDDMDHLRRSIGLRSYGQKDPVIEYRFLSYDMFDELSYNIQWDTIKSLLSVKAQDAGMKHEENKIVMVSNRQEESAVKMKPVKKQDKIGRNDDCPCGSGKKYKHCCENRA